MLPLTACLAFGCAGLRQDGDPNATWGSAPLRTNDLVQSPTALGQAIKAIKRQLPEKSDASTLPGAIIQLAAALTGVSIVVAAFSKRLFRRAFRKHLRKKHPIRKPSL